MGGRAQTFCQKDPIHVWPFKKRVLQGTPFGDVTYRSGAWEGTIQLPHEGSKPVLVRIHAPKTDNLTSFQRVRSVIDSQYDKLSAQILEQAVETYELYAEDDVKSKNIKAEDLVNYPDVDDEDGIWELLTPYRVEVFPPKSGQDFWIGYDVAWWNPHCFLAYVKGEDLFVLEVDG